MYARCVSVSRILSSARRVASRRVGSMKITGSGSECFIVWEHEGTSGENAPMCTTAPLIVCTTVHSRKRGDKMCRATL